MDTIPEKAMGIDNSPQSCLNNGATFLAYPIKELCNLSISLSKFPDNCKITKLKLLYKKTLQTISLISLISKILKKLSIAKHKKFLMKIKLYIS